MADMAADGVADQDVDVLAAGSPSTVVITVLYFFLEERTHIPLRFRLAFTVQVDGLSLLGTANTWLARGPQIGGASDGNGTFKIALDSNGSSVHMQDVTFSGAEGGEEAF